MTKSNKTWDDLEFDDENGREKYEADQMSE